MGKAAVIIEWKDYARVAIALRDNQEWRNLLIWTMGGYTAYRASDYVDLTWGFILGKDAITIVEKKHRWMSKAGRRVSFGEEILQIIEECRQHLNPYSLPHHSLFKGDRGPRAKSLTKRGLNVVLKNIAKRYNLRTDISAHSLRKCFAIHVYHSNGANHEALMIVQAMLGHSSPETTKIYLGIDQARIINIYKNISIYGNRLPIPQ